MCRCCDGFKIIEIVGIILVYVLVMCYLLNLHKVVAEFNNNCSHFYKLQTVLMIDRLVHLFVCCDPALRSIV